MTLGEKLSILRKENNYTQEQLADILSVSRQSVSKWESNIAYPETDKLIRLSTLFNVAIDDLIKDTEKMAVHQNVLQEKQSNIDYSNFFGNWCNIDLKNWDSGYYMAAVVGQDENYLRFYQVDKKKNLNYGIVLKCHIDTVTRLEISKRKLLSLPVLHDTTPPIRDPYEPLIGKTCDIQIHAPNLSTFILSTDGYQKAIVTSIDNNSVQIKDNGTAVILNKGDIVGIVES